MRARSDPWLVPAEHDRSDGEGAKEEREVGQGVREEPARAGRRGLAEELDGQEQESPPKSECRSEVDPADRVRQKGRSVTPIMRRV